MAQPPGPGPQGGWWAWSLSTFCSGLVLSLGMRTHHRLPTGATVIILLCSLGLSGAPALLNYAYPHHY